MQLLTLPTYSVIEVRKGLRGHFPKIVCNTVQYSTGCSVVQQIFRVLSNKEHWRPGHAHSTKAHHIQSGEFEHAWYVSCLAELLLLM